MSEADLMELTRAECLRMLSTAVIGRVVFTHLALPTAQPVSFFLDDEEVIFRTSSDSRLATATNNVVVAFQVDEIDPAARTGWSICGVGEAYEVRHPRRLAELTELAPPSWLPSGTTHTVSIPMQQLSGRQIVLAEGLS